MLYVLAPATGMRIAELLAVEIDKHVSPDCTMIVVRQQVKGSKIVQYLKKDAAYRVVDLCPEAAELLRDITAQYAEQMFEMNEWRQRETVKVGLGFSVPAFVPKPTVRKVRRNRQEVEVAVAS